MTGVEWNTGLPTGDIRDGQVNALAGVTRKLSPVFWSAVSAAMKTFNYTSQLLNGRLRGDGWTVGLYSAWERRSSIAISQPVAPVPAQS